MFCRRSADVVIHVHDASATSMRSTPSPRTEGRSGAGASSMRIGPREVTSSPATSSPRTGAGEYLAGEVLGLGHASSFRKAGQRQRGTASIGTQGSATTHRIRTPWIQPSTSKRGPLRVDGAEHARRAEPPRARPAGGDSGRLLAVARRLGEGSPPSNRVTASASSRPTRASRRGRIGCARFAHRLACSLRRGEAARRVFTTLIPGRLPQVSWRRPKPASPKSVASVTDTF